MQKRILILAVYDPKWSMYVVELIKRRGIIYSYYYSVDNIPQGSVVYTDHGYFVDELRNRRDLVIIYDPDRNCRKVEEAILSTALISGYEEVIVGVDPGSTLSYVALGDGDLILYGSGDLLDFEKDLSYIVECISFRELVVRIGLTQRSGDLVNYVREKFRYVKIELVDESSTSPGISRLGDLIYSKKKLRGLKPFRHRDIYAAYRIALSKGIEVD